MKQDVEVAILFADIVASSRLYEVLEDAAAREIVSSCLGLMEDATDRCSGSVVKTMGDEVLATFPSADAAMDAASEMHQALAHKGGFSLDGAPIELRVGCHIGPVARDERDIFGSAIHTAKRMISLSKARQIVTSSELVAALSPHWRALARPIDLTSVKGQSGERAVFEVLWQPDEATAVRPSLQWIDGPGTQEARLSLRAGRQEICVGDLLPQVAIGRALECDLVLEGHLVSRIHARIERRRGRFHLTDASTNGTYVQPAGQPGQWIRRDSIELVGEGWIWAGGEEEQDEASAIQYALEA